MPSSLNFPPWKHVNDSRALRQRAWYYTKIYADTQDVNGVYVMNVAYHHSTDGGKTFVAQLRFIKNLR